MREIAEVRNTITLQDKMTPVLNKMLKSMESLNKSMSKVDESSSKAFQRASKDILAARNEVARFNQSINEIPSNAQKSTGALGKIKDTMIGIASTLYTIEKITAVIKKMTDFSDELTLIKARIDLMNDGLQTTEELQNLIYQSAQRSRGSYTAMESSVAKFGILAGEAFNSNKEIVAFTETLNKAFIVGGAGAGEMSSAMYQLTQAMASGRLQGDEFRSIIENAPLLAKSISQYMKDVKGYDGPIKELASQGLITADVIKAAVFNASDEINEKFKTFPKTFGQATQQIKNSATRAFEEVNERINSVLNNPAVVTFLSNLEIIIIGLINSLNLIISAIGYMITIIQNLWSILEPILIAIAIVYIPTMLVGLYKLAVGWVVAGAKALWTLSLQIASLIIANWHILLIIAAIAAVIFILNKLGIGVKQVFSFIIGIIYAAWAVIQNIGIGIANGAMWLFDKVKDGFLGFINMIVEKLEWVAGIWDKLFGTDLSIKIGNFSAKLEAEMEKEPEYLEYKDVGEEFNKGMEKGNELWDKGAKALSDLSDKINDGLTVDKVDSTVGVEGTVDITEEDLKLLKDVAATEFVNRYTTLRPSLTANFGDIRETADVNVILDKVGEMMEEALAESLV